MIGTFLTILSWYNINKLLYCQIFSYIIRYIYRVYNFLFFKNKKYSNLNLEMTPIEITLKIISYTPLATICIALIFNSLAFAVFRFSKEFNRNSSMVYLSFIVVLDMAILFTFNLNHYLLPNFGFQLEDINLVSCRVVSFFLFFLCMSIGFLYTFISIDRLVTIYSIPGSFFKKLPFSTTKSACGWSIGLIGISFLINFPLCIINGYVKETVQYMDTNIYNESVNITLKQSTLICYSDAYAPSINLFSLYCNITLVMYCIIPFITTSVCNFFIIKLMVKKKPSNEKVLSTKEKLLLKKKQHMTVSLIIITLLFLFMSTPILFYYTFVSYFSVMPYANEVEIFFAFVHGLNHASVFFTSCCCYPKFRLVFKRFYVTLISKSNGSTSG